MKFFTADGKKFYRKDAVNAVCVDNYRVMVRIGEEEFFLKYFDNEAEAINYSGKIVSSISKEE